PVDDRGVRVALRAQARDLAVLRPRRGDARGRHLAARVAAAARSERALPLGGPAVPRRLRPHPGAAGRGHRRAGGGGRGGGVVEGDICGKSAGVMKVYHNNPPATERVLMPDGWLRTGDLGSLDAEGFLYVTGRLKDLIILGGQNVIPADIEEVVDRVSGVRYSAAVGIDSERTGTQRLHVVA